MTEQEQPQQPTADGVPGDDPNVAQDIGPTTDDGQTPAQTTTVPASMVPDSEQAPEPEAGSPSGSPVHHEGVQGEGAQDNPVAHEGLSPESQPEPGNG